MSVLAMETDSLQLDAEVAKAAGKAASEAYRSQKPYPYGSFDDFLPPEVLDRVREELKALPEAETSFDRPQEKLKTSYVPERLPLYTRNLFYVLNSRPFVQFLENLTGIKGLIPDPYFAGGGVHVVANGGHLDIHADFNHNSILNLERRLNVLIYLNKDWKEEYGGSFEIWNNDMTEIVKSFVPEFNRMVCFNTGSTTWHGNPTPVNHPQGEPRMSLALYYYTATWDGTKRSHSTLFKPRPGTADQVDRESRRHELLQDLVPPIVFRRILGPLRRLGF
ncbi:Proline 4-hydroxylase (includes Rps23 Pro-64 3,4-dihydroxylase Tpa1), contains SM-20 domain [Paracoccus halophilus]|uniref:Proline 4-hydroxylase (Includes Rps23 Pro-64 3,4-dihydroxylase Tpa1), contains SM-20 domain n=1 Tax=Paracoccus halophilus TaxID=376733 RepID=A0A099F7F8_9RHOB|nr:2OG-Fe(II) oxygenase [Paracoccus halophilus]KGJ06211.1 proline hydroxylase [Paracoccus halophilus]SFA45722.1 Proline 4-hydroxylase (includes Rps23 Pro-64 3,4-dihydroxylase Tpa1), contains SM-20 domain [Paracoccus halophilus]